MKNRVKHIRSKIRTIINTIVIILLFSLLFISSYIIYTKLSRVLITNSIDHAVNDFLDLHKTDNDLNKKVKPLKCNFIIGFMQKGDSQNGEFFGQQGLMDTLKKDNINLNINISSEIFTKEQALRFLTESFPDSSISELKSRGALFNEEPYGPNLGKDFLPIRTSTIFENFLRYIVYEPFSEIKRNFTVENINYFCIDGQMDLTLTEKEGFIAVYKKIENSNQEEFIDPRTNGIYLVCTSYIDHNHYDITYISNYTIGNSLYIKRDTFSLAVTQGFPFYKWEVKELWPLLYEFSDYDGSINHLDSEISGVMNSILCTDYF